jgi:hypothetical protein
LTQVILRRNQRVHNSGRWKNDLKKKLTEKGIPEDEIAFIHDANTVQIQDRLIVRHALDCLWWPSELEQRLGRIVWQGNGNAEVEIPLCHRETFDSYLYKKSSRKPTVLIVG